MCIELASALKTGLFDALTRNGAAAQLVYYVFLRRPYEPQSYLDLANAIGAEKPILAAILYEAAIAGEWDDRFLRLQTVIAEEYVLFVTETAVKRKNDSLSQYLEERVAALDGDYRIQAHYFGNNGNALLAPTYVMFSVMTDIGLDSQTRTRYVKWLVQEDEVVTLPEVSF